MSRARLGRALATAASMLVAAAFAATAHAADKIRVANFQNSIIVPLFYGLDKGYFKEAGLEIEFVKIASGAASVSAVASAQADIGLAAVSVPMFARSNGVPVKLFMAVDQEGPPNHYGTHITASARSGIKSFKDMKGKSVMINAFGTAGELAIRERLQQAGVSWDDVKKVVVPFPQMPAQLELGNADVAVTIFPMQAAIMSNKAIGGHVLARGTVSASADKPVTGAIYFATDDWLAKNQKAAVAFGRAYLKSAKEIDADPKARLALVMKISGMTKEVAETVPASWFQSLAITKESVEPNYDALVSTGMMTKKFPIEDVIATLPF
jgi:NitT/TauT family transport system substrate-binding protein